MFRVLLAFALLFGSGIAAKVGSGWDPDGLTVDNEDDAGSHWDPNG